MKDNRYDFSLRSLYLCIQLPRLLECVPSSVRFYNEIFSSCSVRETFASELHTDVTTKWIILEVFYCKMLCFINFISVKNEICKIC